MENKQKKPKIFLILKILGFIFLIVGIVGAGIFFSGLSDPSGNLQIGFMFMFVFGTFLGLIFTIVGFLPSIEKLQIKYKKYILDETKEDLKILADNHAEIINDAVKKTSSAVKEGLNDNPKKKFCPYCGEPINPEDEICSNCENDLLE